MHHHHTTAPHRAALTVDQRTGRITVAIQTATHDGYLQIGPATEATIPNRRTVSLDDIICGRCLTRTGPWTTINGQTVADVEPVIRVEFETPIPLPRLPENLVRRLTAAA